MAGGKGERFWPLSAHNTPKPFLNILGAKTMIQLTVERILGLVPAERVFVVLGKAHAEVARKQLPELPEGNFLVEPLGRDTAPCIGFSAVSLLQTDPEAIMIVIPADHFIPDIGEFVETLRYGAEIANQGDYLVTIGIRPGRPETGYGYIKAGEQMFSSNHRVCFKVEEFVEKPDEVRARRYLEEGNYFWNAGMFVWKARNVLGGISKHMPELHKGLLALQEAMAKKNEPLFTQIYGGLVRTSIDYGLMEKADNVLMIRGDFVWDDVGTWSSLRRVQILDENGNYCFGDAVCIDTRNSVVFGEGVRVGVIGASNMVVVASRDGVLVCDVNRAQEVRDVARVMETKKSGSS